MVVRPQRGADGKYFSAVLGMSDASELFSMFFVSCYVYVPLRQPVQWQGEHSNNHGLVDTLRLIVFTGRGFLKKILLNDWNFSHLF